MTERLELSDEDFNAAIKKKLLQQTIINILKKIFLSHNKEIESFSKETQDIKKNQVEILELKNAVTKIKSC